MTIGFNRLRRTAAPRAIAIWAMSLLAAGNATAGDDASRWDGDARSAMRLIAGSSATPERAPTRAGIEIRLKNGWHTYWRYPGDAGVPPRFDFAGSQNVKSVEVLWPAPQRIPEQGLVAIGYTGDVILPLTIVPQIRGEPVKLRLKLDYATKEAGAYPINLVTYEIVGSKAKDPKKAALTKAFLKHFASKETQDSLEEIGYAPLPDEVRTKVDAAIDALS